MLPKSFGQKSKGSTTDKSTKSSDTDWDALRAFMPTSFGKQQKKNDVTEEFEKTKREVIYTSRQCNFTLLTCVFRMLLLQKRKELVWKTKTVKLKQ